MKPKPSDSAPSVFTADQPHHSTHKFFLGDARELDVLGDESVHLIVTSPPYGNLKEYPRHDGQLGNIESYDEFL